VTVTVTQPPPPPTGNITISLSAPKTIAKNGVALKITANVSGTTDPVSVQFFLRNSAIANSTVQLMVVDQAAPYEYNFQVFQSSTYEITAQVVSGGTTVATAAPLTIRSSVSGL